MLCTQPLSLFAPSSCIIVFFCLTTKRKEKQDLCCAVKWEGWLFCPLHRDLFLLRADEAINCDLVIKNLRERERERVWYVRGANKSGPDRRGRKWGSRGASVDFSRRRSRDLHNWWRPTVSPYRPGRKCTQQREREREGSSTMLRKLYGVKLALANHHPLFHCICSLSLSVYIEPHPSGFQSSLAKWNCLFFPVQLYGD